MGSVTDLIGQLGSSYFENRFSDGSSGGGSVIQGPMLQQTLGLPFVDVVNTVDKQGLVYDPNAACGAGKWIRRRRKRRKVLVTNSEIAGLAKLKGVVGSGQVMKEWIATHS